MDIQNITKKQMSKGHIYLIPEGFREEFVEKMQMSENESYFKEMMESGKLVVLDADVFKDDCGNIAYAKLSE